MRGSISWRTICALSAAMAILGLAAASANAAIVFYEDFESPLVNGYAEGTTPPSKWVRGAQGYGGGSHGLDNKNGGDFNAPFGNDQAYAFRYTNSGLTTAEGVVCDLVGNVTYTVSFDVVKDGVSVFGTPALPYTVQLIAFAPGVARDDCRSTPAGSAVLASAGGNAPADGSWATVTFSYRTDNGSEYLFYDLGVRRLGASDSATMDNVLVASKTLHWDINGATAGAGGATPSGIWDAAGTSWSTDSTGAVATGAWEAGHTAFFSAAGDATGTYTVTVEDQQDIDGMVFEEGAVTLASGTAASLRLTNNTTVSVASGKTATVQPAITQNAAGRQLTKIGLGTLVLAGDNTYTGTTTVTAGKLILSGSNAAATGAMTLNGGVTQFDSPASINGAGRNVTINAGAAVAFGPSFGIGNIADAVKNRVVLSSAGAIAADNYADKDFDFTDLGLTAAWFGAVGNVTYTGALTPYGGAYRLGGGGGTLTMASVISGSGYSLTVGGGSVVLSTANDYTGVTTVAKGGTLSVSSLANAGQPSNIGAYPSAGAAGLVISAGTFRYTGDTATTDRGFTLAAMYSIIDVSSAGKTLTLGECSLGAYTLNVTGGAGSRLSLGATALTGAATLSPTTADLTVASVSGAQNLTLGGTATGNIVTGVIGTETGKLTKSGNSVWKLSGANTYSGATTVGGGVLLLDNANAIPGGIATAGGTSALNFTGGVLGLGVGDFTRGVASTVVVAGVHFTGAGGWAAYGADRLVNLGGASATIVWALADAGLNAQTLILGASAATHMVTLQNPLDLGNAARTVQVDNGAAAIDATLSGLISGAGGGLTKTGAGTLMLAVANTYTGTTTVSGGTLLYNANDMIYTGAVTVNGAGAVLAMGASSDTVGAVTLTAGDITGSGTLTSTGAFTMNNAAAASVSVVLAGSGALNKSAAGVLTLTGNNTYTGLTTVSAGTLTLSGNNIAATGGVTLTAGTLNVNSATALGTGTVILTAGTLDNTSGSAKTLTPANPVTLNGNFAFSTAAGTANNNLTFGAGAVTNAGSRTITLNGTGTTLAFGGVMTNTLAGIQTTTVNGAGNTLVLGGYALSNSATNYVDVINGTGNVTISGAVTNGASTASGLTYSGTGTLTLAGANTYKGLTTVSAGTLTLSGDNTAATGGVTLTAGTLNVNSPTALGTGTVILTAGTLNNTSGSAKTLTPANPVTLNGNFAFSTAAGTANNNLTFGAGAVTNAGSRTITLNGTGTTLAFGGVMTNTLAGVQTTTVNGPGNTLVLGGYALSNSATNYIDVIAGTGNVTITGPVTNGGTATASGLTMTGAGTLTLSGTNSYTGATTVSAGKLLVNGSLAAGSAVSVASGATLGGIGTIGGAVSVATGGILAPGASAGPLSTGPVTMAANSIYQWEIGSSAADKVVVTGNLTLTAGWKLSLASYGGAVPANYVMYDLFTYTGSFGGSIVANVIAKPADWPDFKIRQDTTPGAGRVYLMFGQPGDTNNDGVVDAADYITVKKNFGKALLGAVNGDFNDSGQVDWADLAILMKNFGAGAGAPGVTPEPATLGLLAIGALALLRRRRA